MNCIYHIKDTMPRNITLPNKNVMLYIVTREEPSSAHFSLGLKVSLTGDQVVERGILIEQSELFSYQMREAQFDKILCLNSFNMSFMPFTEKKCGTILFSLLSVPL